MTPVYSTPPISEKALEYSSHRPKIMFVVDHCIHLLTTKDHLEDLDVEILVAHSGMEAVAHALKYRFALVIMGVDLTDMTGFDAAALIQEKTLDDPIPIMFISQVAIDEEQRSRGQSVGAIDYLTVPLERDVFHWKVRFCLNTEKQRVRRLQAENNIKALTSQQADLLGCLEEGVFFLDRGGYITQSNTAALVAFCVNSLTGIHFKELLATGPNSKTDSHKFLNRYSVDNTWAPFYEEEGLFRRNDNSIFPISCSCRPFYGENGDVTGGVLTFMDMTPKRNAEARLNHLTNYDGLTGMANRTMFYQHLERSLSRVSRGNGMVAVLFVDLDNFKNINDSLGHEFGDLLLKGVAERLSQTIRAYDLIARIAGDEFALVLDDLDKPQDASVAADHILDCLKEPFLVEKNEIYVGCSIGIATSPHSGTSVEDLAKAADTALHWAKAQGKNCPRFFESDMQQRINKRQMFENDLRKALPDRQFHVYFQPQIDQRTGVIKGFEALIRWEHPQWGFISPTEFIPVAEETGLIDEIGEWVLNQSCAQAMIWRRTRPDLRISVNISARQLQCSHFDKIIADILTKTGLPARALEIELTESTVMKSPETAVLMLEKIHDLGVRIAIDDFGTGYSSLAYLSRLPVDVLKIDRAFVNNIGVDCQDEAIVKAVVSLADSLNLEVIAEGVETQAQKHALSNLHCFLLQGFLYSPAVPREKVPHLFEQDWTFVQNDSSDCQPNGREIA